MNQSFNFFQTYQSLVNHMGKHENFEEFDIKIETNNNTENADQPTMEEEIQIPQTQGILFALFFLLKFPKYYCMNILFLETNALRLRFLPCHQMSN